MDTRIKLRNNLVRKLQQLSFEKLEVINTLLTRWERQPEGNTKTLEFGGKWADFDRSFFDEMTDQLQFNRSRDRQSL